MVFRYNLKLFILCLLSIAPLQRGKRVSPPSKVALGQFAFLRLGARTVVSLSVVSLCL